MPSAEPRELAQVESSGPEETRCIARGLGRALIPGTVLALEGDLGSGKTVFVQGLAEGLDLPDPGAIQSPTFALVQEHRGGRIPLCHADLYRLGALEAGQIGLEEYWEPAGGRPAEWVVAVEWADRAESLLPASDRLLRVRLEIISEDRRRILFFGSNRWKTTLRNLSKNF